MTTEKQLYSHLKEYFGYGTFRSKQKEIILSILEGHDNLVIMPTGGGKSICYQLPAILLEGLTLVISPLIALMKDQVDGLIANGIGAAYINSSQTFENQQIIFDDILAQKIKLLYVAPESLVQLEGVLSRIKLSLIAVDEAHCISAWGHDFRPAYTQLGFLKNKFKNTAIVALTATADKATREDIAKQLNLINYKLNISSFDRPNLSLEVRPGTDRIKQILNFIDDRTYDCGIVYCLSRKATETLAEKLKGQGHAAEAYHAGLSHETRVAVQDRFVNDATKIVCATVAFGMGIDKSNVRWVIHYNLPKNIEGYYQEIGRAGRDGVTADTLLFYSYADVIQLQKFAAGSGNQDVQKAKLERMQQFSEALSCRRKVLLSYFGEFLENDCGNCDVCKNPPKFFDGTILAQKVLSTIHRVKQQETLPMVVDVLRGAQNNSVLDKSFNELSTYGIGKDVSWKDWQQYIIQLINQGFIEIAFHENSQLKLTDLAKGVLFKKQKVALAKVKIKTAVPKQKLGVSKPVANTLFEDLRTLRLKIAKEEERPAYQIFSDATLKEMAVARPVTDDEFLEISGVGRKKMENYGYEFIKTIIAFQKNKIKKKPKKEATYITSAKLFKKGLSVEQITEERGLAESTVLSHLCTAYQTDKSVPLKTLVTAHDMDKVLKAKAHVEDATKLKSFFDYFKEEVTYGTIKIALAVLE